MDWKYNWENVIIFEYKDRRFEILIDENLNDDEINDLVRERIEELDADYELYKSTDHSDLFVDKRKKPDLENGDNY